MKIYFGQPCKADNTIICYQHPVYKNYGVGIKISADRLTADVSIVFGELDGTTPLETVVDFSPPLDVLAWAFTLLSEMQNTVNKPCDVENLRTTQKYIYQE